ncbi:hypothetical protein FB567DRAFT_83685 [Paraphoma chrysanthemicola]|uniref:Uncharacterized protein n=1 Tax=Paraphoma chrysanthemicola TaxID=798071 RepID=A0A8K0R5P5_9PLEO|nr:hypothetical protein FB567DRAFT_83685 [Paraphoma chrysanthemicola]
MMTEGATTQDSHVAEHAREDYDSFGSSDDWGTPHEGSNVDELETDKHDANNASNAVQFGFFDQRDVQANNPGSFRRKSATGKRNQKANTEGVHFSHSALTLEDGDRSYLDTSLQAGDTNYIDARAHSGGLFVPEDEATLVIKGKTELKNPDNTLRRLPYMDALVRARAMKVDVENNIAVLKPLDQQNTTKCRPEDDHENQLIKKLRSEEQMSWAEIANVLNQERRNRGEAANFTASAAYSRYVCNVPRVATTVGEIGFDVKDYMHLRNPSQYTEGEGTGSTSKAGKKRVKNYDNAKELEANVRKQISEVEHAELETAEKTEMLMNAVAKVERNFWVLVADEMERSTTKLYPPQVLASRYHSI